MNKHSSYSGFLYHPSSQKILLQNLNSGDASWGLIRGKESFEVLVQELLKIKLNKKDIYSVYDYNNTYILYGEVKEMFSTKDSLFGWFSAKEILKLKLSPQTKQDIIVGQRVINSQIRKASGELTIG